MNISKPHIFEFKRSINLKYFWDLLLCRYLECRSRQHKIVRPERIAIFAHDYIGIQINQFGIYEKDELQTLFRFLEPLFEEFQNSEALDIGANIGNHSLYFQKYFIALQNDVKGWLNDVNNC